MIVRLTPRGRFLGGLPRSDTLFGALCWGIRWTHGERPLLDLLEACDAGDPPLILSSAFPFAVGDGEAVYYLPRPLHWPPQPLAKDVETLALAKRLRRARYCSRSVFSAALTGRPFLEDGVLDDPHRGFLAAAGEPVPHVRDEDVDRNTINRVTGAVQEGRLFFRQETGVAGGGGYFLARVRREEARPLLQAALRFLEDRGLGGDASVGRGQVRFEVEERELLPDDHSAPARLTLSLMHPSEADRAHLADHVAGSAYRLVKRKGRVESLYAPTEQPWKSTLVMLAEGSVFPRDGDRAVYGSAPTVKTEPFRVRHNGFGYTVGCSDVA